MISFSCIIKLIWGKFSVYKFCISHFTMNLKFVLFNCFLWSTYGEEICYLYTQLSFGSCLLQSFFCNSILGINYCFTFSIWVRLLYFIFMYKIQISLPCTCFFLCFICFCPQDENTLFYMTYKDHCPSYLLSAFNMKMFVENYWSGLFSYSNIYYIFIAFKFIVTINGGVVIGVCNRSFRLDAFWKHNFWHSSFYCELPGQCICELLDIDLGRFCHYVEGFYTLFVMNFPMKSMILQNLVQISMSYSFQFLHRFSSIPKLLSDQNHQSIRPSSYPDVMICSLDLFNYGDKSGIAG